MVPLQLSCVKNSKDSKKIFNIQLVRIWHIITDLYPQWLIEVEKKRADAELIRAKAEEQRATIAAKNVEAALVQADALKRLADAASAQAEAIARIATVLETRGQRDMLAM